MPPVSVTGIGKTIAAELSKRIMVLDGAMGTMIQRHRLEEKDFRGLAYRLLFVPIIPSLTNISIIGHRLLH